MKGWNIRTKTGVYRFNVALNDRSWTLFLPGTWGASYESHRMDEAERTRILPRVIEFLEHIKWFGLSHGRIRFASTNAQALPSLLDQLLYFRA